MSAFLAAILLHGICLANAINFTTVYERDQLYNFITASDGKSGTHHYTSYIDLRYVAVFGDRLFLSHENEHGGIPASLVWLPTNVTCTTHPKFTPFHSWEFHEKHNCETIQFARGMETDTDGRLWVLDQGSSNCSSKLWIFELLNNDKTERVHHFPDTVVTHSYKNRWLRDIVLDKTPDDYLAYITDYFAEHIIVYSRKMDKSWSVKTPGRKLTSLALSPNSEARQLYLARDFSNELYSASVSELRNEGGNATVKFIGEWTEKPTRMLIDSANILYAAFYRQNYLSIWNISEPFREQRFYEVRGLDSGLPFTFALDTNGNFWVTAANKPGVKNDTKYKILKAAVGARSYIFSTSAALTTPYVNEGTWDVVKSTQMPTSKYGTPRPALESNGGVADLAEDHCKSQQSLITVLIWLLVCCLVLCGTLIAWLTLRMRRMQTSFRQNSKDNLELIPSIGEIPH